MPRKTTAAAAVEAGTDAFADAVGIENARTSRTAKANAKRRIEEATLALNAADEAYRTYLLTMAAADPGTGRSNPEAKRRGSEYRKAAKEAEAMCESAGMVTEDGNGLPIDGPARRTLVLKSLTVADRINLAQTLVPGLTGSSRQRWIETGMSSAEQLAYDRTIPKATPAQSSPEQRRTRLRDAAVTAKAKAEAEPKPARAPRAPRAAKPSAPKVEIVGTSAPDLARSLGVEPRVFRAFIRDLRGKSSKNATLLATRDGRYDFTDAQVKLLTSAWKKHTS